MATTLITLTQQVLEGMGQYRLLDVTTGGSATVATSTHLRRWVGAADVLNDRWFVRFTNLNDTTPSTANRDRLITDSTTSTVTYERATSVNTSTTDPDQFLLLSFDPSFITAAINSAGQYLFHRGMYLPIRDETLFVDNLLSNSSFEDTISGSDHPSWTNVGSPTVTAETTHVMLGSQAARLRGSGSAAGQMHQGVDNTQLANIGGKTIHLQGWVKEYTASRARLRIDRGDGSTFSNHDYHSGVDQWERQLVEADVLDTAGAMTIRAYIEGGTASVTSDSRFDAVVMWIDPLYRYTIPSTMVRGPYRVQMQMDVDNPNGHYRSISRGLRPISGRALRLTGKGAMSTLSADTDSAEISGDQQKLLVTRAIFELYSTLGGAPSSQRDHYLREADRWYVQAERMLGEGMADGPKLATDEADGWHVENEGETRYLMLDHVRDSLTLSSSL